MPPSLPSGDRSQWTAVKAGTAALWSVVRVPILALLQLFAALILIFEEWGWRPLMEMLGRLAKYKPIARLELWIASLPPYASLVVFVLPTAFLMPLKFVAMWLLAKGQVFAASGLFIGAKISSTALVARIFMLTKPALMRIGWFARAYTWFMPWKDALFAKVRASWAWRYGRMLKTAIKLEAKQAWARVRPRLERIWIEWRPRLRGAAESLRVSARQVWRRVTGS
jgi:hypothetical protein